MNNFFGSDITPFKVNIGKVPGAIPVTIICDLSAVSTTERTVWPAATLAAAPQVWYNRKDTETNLSIVSTSALDAYPSGIGVQTVKLGLIREDYTAYETVIRMNGTTPVTLDQLGAAFPGIANNYMNPELVGTDPAPAGGDPALIHTAQGDILLKHGTDILGVIPVGTPRPVNITRQSPFTTPLGTTFYLKKVQIYAGKDDDISVVVYAVNPVNGLYVRQLELRSYETFSPALEEEWIPFPEKHLLEARALSTLAGNKEISVVMSGILKVNSVIR